MVLKIGRFFSKRKFIWTNHQFSGGYVSFREGTWRIIPGLRYVVRIAPIYFSHVHGHLEGVPQPDPFQGTWKRSPCIFIPRILVVMGWSNPNGMIQPNWGPLLDICLLGLQMILGGPSQDLYAVFITPICKPFSWPFGRGPTTLLRGLISHGYEPPTNWDDPPSMIQVLQAVTSSSPILRGHQQPLKGSLNQRIARFIFIGSI